MADEIYKALKAACARIVAGTSKGSGYLVGRDRVATCAHVVKPVGVGGTASVAFSSAELVATVLKLDEAADAALLALPRPLNDITPLQLAGSVDRKAPWEGYGFPELTKGEGLPLEGAVMDPESKDDQSAPVLLLRSEQVAAGEGASLHGFSGSPVLVDGMVVGHLKRYIKDRESPLRPAYGYVYATPSRAVLQLLGAQPAVTVIQPPDPLFPTASLPSLGEDEYHVFISYRSTDRKWADQLITRLEGIGFKVFIDHRELVPGTQLANTLQKALATCKSAVVIMSSGWLASPWCQEEGNVLLKRSIETPSFHVVPVRIDKSQPPAMWDGRFWLDFSDSKLPEGHELRRLQFGLIGKTPPREDSIENRVFKAETAATDELIREVKAAAATGPEKVYALWKKWREAEMPDGPANLYVAQLLISLAVPDRVIEVLKHAQPGERADQLLALALAKTNDIDGAIQILRKLYDRKKTETDSETGGILAGRYKQRWIKGSRTNNADLRASFEIYRETFERTKDSYPGINAAAMAMELGDRGEMLRIAQQVLSSLQGARVEDFDHWKLATFGEVYLFLGDLDNAKKWYGKAVAYCPECHQDIAVMRRQARRNLEKLGLERSALDAVLDVPHVAAFTGHMVDAPGRATPRFPSDKVPAVRKALSECLKRQRIGYGFSSAARGSDLIFIEELKKVNGRPRVFLPFPRDQFKKTSVGNGWNPAFERALQGLEVVELSQELPPEDQHPDAYAACNRKILEEAIAKAQLLDEEPLLIAVWNGNPGDGAGGTADAVRDWQNEGHPVEIIDISKL
ncbi:TRAFs-binding domain-containing protein [Nitrospira sp. Nam80]